MVVGFGQKSMDNPYGKFVLDKMDEALTLSEAYVEKYLPEEEVENIKEEEQGKDTALRRSDFFQQKCSIFLLWQ